MSKLDEVRKKIADAQEEVKKICQDTFNEVAKEIFDKYPKLESFGWNQYTPYFNDGDTCEFSVHTYDPNINGICGYESGELDELGDWYISAQRDIEKLLDSLDEHFFHATWGDHVTVTVNRNGTIEENECNHD